MEKLRKKSEKRIGEIGYTIDNTTKTRALFEINKGVGKVDGVTVNMSLPEQNGRVHFINRKTEHEGIACVVSFLYTLINYMLTRNKLRNTIWAEGGHEKLFIKRCDENPFGGWMGRDQLCRRSSPIQASNEGGQSHAQASGQRPRDS